MLRLLRHILLAAAVLLFVPFAVANRHAVAVGYWPFETVLEVPLFLLVLAACALGVLLLFGVRAVGFVRDGLSRAIARPRPAAEARGPESP